MTTSTRSPKRAWHADWHWTESLSCLPTSAHSSHKDCILSTTTTTNTSSCPRPWSARSALPPMPRPSRPNAMRRPDSVLWHQAMVREMEAHLENGTWELVKLPHRRKAIGSKWVFKVKHNPDGTSERYKACLVAKGFGQRPGVDFDEMFAPTTKWAALHAILVLATLKNLELESIDISNAYLNGELHNANMYTTARGQPVGNPGRAQP
jgi:hypothetical protein